MKRADWIRFVRLVYFDLLNGIFRRGHYYGGVFLFVFVLVFQATSDMASVSDCYVNLFSGHREYTNQGDELFRIPVEYVFVNILLSLVVYSYLKRDLTGYGRYILILSNNTRSWWFSKCIWCIVTVCAYYVIVFLAVCAVILAKGGSGFGLSDSSYYMLNIQAEQIDIRQTGLYISIYIMPVVVSAMLSMIQLLAELMIRPFIGIIVVVSIVMMSLLYMSPVLIGNYSMLLRSRLVVENGMHYEIGLCISIFVMVLVSIIGLFYLSKRDLIYFEYE